jgi:mannitol operon transcriptional antiterminator
VPSQDERLPLDSRQARIARSLLGRNRVASGDELASELKLTRRVVFYNLPAVGSYLDHYGLRLVQRRGVGLWVEGSDRQRDAAIAGLDAARGPAVLDTETRQTQVILALLEAAPASLRSESLEAVLGVSRPTIRRDVRAAERWLEQHRLHLRRLPGVGLAVRGSEVEVRAALLALVLEELPPHELIAQASHRARETDHPAGSLVGFVGSLDLPLYRGLLSLQVGGLDDDDSTLITATLGLAILVARLRASHPARLVRGRLRSLLDHPVSDTAHRVALAVEERIGVTLPPAEVAALTESLLGLVELTDAQAAPQADVLHVVDRIVIAGAARLHPSLADDDLLRASLTEHLRRLDVRLRYRLPVSNPLRDEVRRRYPDVYRVAHEILAELGPLEGTAIPEEEVGFLTMYLAGSLERHSLRPKIQVTVVCPAGMATVWILVSRLLAEFPQLEVARVVSKAALEGQVDIEGTDLVISTIPLDGLPVTVPSLVVSPLLSERDVRRISRIVGQPAH